MGLALKPDGPVQIGAGHGKHLVVRGQADKLKAVQLLGTGGNGGCFDEPRRTGNPGPEVRPQLPIHGFQHGQIAHEFGHGVEPPGDVEEGALAMPQERMSSRASNKMERRRLSAQKS